MGAPRIAIWGSDYLITHKYQGWRGWGKIVVTEGYNGGKICVCFGGGGYNVSTKRLVYLSTVGRESILIQKSKPKGKGKGTQIKHAIGW